MRQPQDRRPGVTPDPAEDEDVRLLLAGLAEPPPTSAGLDARLRAIPHSASDGHGADVPRRALDRRPSRATAARRVWLSAAAAALAFVGGGALLDQLARLDSVPAPPASLVAPASSGVNPLLSSAGAWLRDDRGEAAQPTAAWLRRCLRALGQPEAAAAGTWSVDTALVDNQPATVVRARTAHSRVVVAPARGRCATIAPVVRLPPT